MTNSIHLLIASFIAFTISIVHSSVPLQEESSLKISEDETRYKKKSSSVLPKHFISKTIIIPHDDKKFRGGEDAASTTDQILVVSDGVGGWANRGVNPGLFSRKLTETITEKYTKALEKEEEINNIDIKKLVVESNIHAASQHLGSATCTVLRLLNDEEENKKSTRKKNRIQTLNVGDSGYSIHRGLKNSTIDYTVVYESESGQRDFNFPYQLGGKYGDDVYDKGVTTMNEHTLEDDDVIVIVSDGVNDNLFSHEYHDCLAAYTKDDDESSTILISLSVVADCIARKAYFLGHDPTYNSPFAQSAKLYGKNYAGGKHDDITVTVALIVNSDDDSLLNDVYKNESIYVYKDEDGIIQSHSKLPTYDDIQRLQKLQLQPENSEL